MKVKLKTKEVKKGGTVISSTPIKTFVRIGRNGVIKTSDNRKDLYEK